MHIRITRVYPPIPTRAFDWHAWIDGCEESAGLQGYGATADEAIADLKERMGDQ